MSRNCARPAPSTSTTKALATLSTIAVRHSSCSILFSSFFGLRTGLRTKSRANTSDFDSTAFRALPVEVLHKVIDMVDNEGRKSLKRVCLWWNQVTREGTTSLSLRCPSGMRALIGYPRLESLCICGANIGEPDYQGGKFMQNLRCLSLKNVVCVPFTTLGCLPSLTQLEITSSDITSMDGLESLRHLEVLNLHSVLSSFAFPMSACHPKLRRASFVDCFCIRIQTRFLGSCRNLEYLHIDSSLETPVDDLSFVINTPRLKHLAIAICAGESESVNQLSLEPLSQLKHLQYLNVKGHADLDYSPIYPLNSLTRLVPGLCNDIQFANLMTNLKCASQLNSIELFECEEMTDYSISLLPSLCPGIFRLLIIDCPKITQDAAYSLRKMPILRCLQLSPEMWWSSFSNLDEWRTLCVNVQLDDI